MEDCRQWVKTRLKERGTKPFDFVQTVPCYDPSRSVSNSSLAGNLNIYISFEFDYFPFTEVVFGIMFENVLIACQFFARWWIANELWMLCSLSSSTLLVTRENGFRVWCLDWITCVSQDILEIPRPNLCWSFLNSLISLMTWQNLMDHQGVLYLHQTVVNYLSYTLVHLLLDNFLE